MQGVTRRSLLPIWTPAVDLNMSDEKYDFDFFVIGGGSGGVRAARVAATFGAKVGLCELKLDAISTDHTGGMGGTCVLRGCIPKKFMVYAGEFTDECEDAKAYGWDIPQKPTLDWKKFIGKKRQELERLSGLYKKNLTSAGGQCFQGRGHVIDRHTVRVNDKEYKVRHLCIATGGRPSKPPIEGKDLAVVSDHVLDLDELPKKIVIVGGGYIACEQACIFHSLGVETHFVFRQDYVLRGFDQECREFAQQQYSVHGMKMHPENSPSKIEKVDGKLKVTFEPKKGDKWSLEGVDICLLATGRNAVTKGIGLESTDVKLDEKGGVIVDKHSKTNVDNIWAVGDVTNRIPLTPVARMEGMCLAHHLFGPKDSKTQVPDHDVVASVVFSSPNLASVGLTEEAAIEELKDFEVFSSSFTPLKQSLSRKDIKCLTKLLVDSKTQKVVGVHMVGAEAAEIVQGLAAAIKAGITKHTLDITVGLHPTSAEEFVTMWAPKRVYKDGKLQK
ncbi:hypothetical protein WJX74_000245 [Apatococcus lobatus]|uniref:Glutathione reductase n=1 Tax=Apatococcus lobatus TaxID=904363 RepID=A0AAW1Q623_9CHLO